MKHPEDRTQAESLYAFLRGEMSREARDVPDEESALGAALQEFARQTQADPRFKADLEKRLMNASQPAGSSNHWDLQMISKSLFAVTRTVAYAGLAIALVLGLGWAVRSLVPRPDNLGGAPTETASISRTPDSAPAPTRTPAAPGIGITPGVAGDSSLQLPGGQVLLLDVPFPAAPAEAPVYRLVTGSPVTPEEARQKAEQLGIQGQVYRWPSESGDTNYVVSDGWSQVQFMGTVDYFSYTADITTVLEDRSDGLPFEQQAAVAQEWLVIHGLLEDPAAYQAEPLHPWPNTVRFVPRLDGRPVRFEAFGAPMMDVEISPAGNVVAVTYSRFLVQPVGKSLPVISAQKAWERALAYQEGAGVVVSARDAQPLNTRTWLREYPLGQRADLWDYASWLTPLEAGVQPLVYFRNFPVAGDLQAFLSEISMGQFTHAWGQFEETDGRRIFRLEGWEPAEENAVEGEAVYGSLVGTVRREGGEAYFLAQNGQKMLLPGLPDDVPDGQNGTVWGKPVESGAGVLEWHILQTSDPDLPQEFRTGWMGQISLEPQPVDVTPTPPFRFEIGQRVEGLEGGVTVLIWDDDINPEKTEVNFFASPADGFPDGLEARLAGPNLEGIEAQHMQPVRLWGTITGQEGARAVIEVERWEATGTPEKIEAWLGTWEVMTLDGKEVALFTAQDGQQYVLNSSLQYGLNSIVGRPGDKVIIEGVLIEGKAVGGYPVIEERAGQMAGKITDLSQYQIHSNQPVVMFPEKKGWTALPGGRMAVEKIELVYLTFDLSHGSLPAQDTPPTYLQPAWRFTGHYDGGLEFEILVQALPDPYLAR